MITRLIHASLNFKPDSKLFLTQYRPWTESTEGLGKKLLSSEKLALLDDLRKKKKTTTSQANLAPQNLRIQALKTPALSR